MWSPCCLLRRRVAARVSVRGASSSMSNHGGADSTSLAEVALLPAPGAGSR